LTLPTLPKAAATAATTTTKAEAGGKRVLKKKRGDVSFYKKIAKTVAEKKKKSRLPLSLSVRGKKRVFFFSLFLGWSRCVSLGRGSNGE
jgi:hypothetical protein